MRARGVADVNMFARELLKYEAMSDAEIVRCAEVCLRNVEPRRDLAAISLRFDAESDLRTFLVPEICERIQPGTRTALRRITTSIAEHDPDPARPSIFVRIWQMRSPSGTAARARQERVYEQARREAAAARSRIALLSQVDRIDLAWRVEEAIGASDVGERWQPTEFVYDPALTYRLVPALVERMMTSLSADRSDAARDARERGGPREDGSWR